MKADIAEKQGNKATGESAIVKWLRSVLIFVVVAAALGLCVFLWWISRGHDGSTKELGIFTVRRGDLPITVTEAGDIKALNSTDIMSEVEGQTKIISIVDEGTAITPEDVNNGKVLVELDSSSIKERLTQQQITFSIEEASYTEAKESLDIQIKQNDSDIKAGEIKVRFALIDLRKYLGEVVAEKLMSGAANPENEDNKITSLIDGPNLGGGAVQRLRELSDDITLAESRFEQASDRFIWTQKLYDKEYVAETELRGDELAMQSSKIQMARARTALELFRLYEFPKEAEKLLSDYNEANRELERI